MRLITLVPLLLTMHGIDGEVSGRALAKQEQEEVAKQQQEDNGGQNEGDALDDNSGNAEEEDNGGPTEGDAMDDNAGSAEEDDDGHITAIPSEESLSNDDDPDAVDDNSGNAEEDDDGHIPVIPSEEPLSNDDDPDDVDDNSGNAEEEDNEADNEEDDSGNGEADDKEEDNEEDNSGNGEEEDNEEDIEDANSGTGEDVSFDIGGDDARGWNDDIGFFLTILSAFFNGTFMAWGNPKVHGQRPPPHPVIFNSFLLFGCGFTSLFVPLFHGEPYTWSWYGFLGGCVMGFVGCFNFPAVGLIGLPSTLAISQTCGIIVAFFWGSMGPSQISRPVLSWPGSILAILCLCAGALIMTSSTRIAVKFLGMDPPPMPGPPPAAKPPPPPASYDTAEHLDGQRGSKRGSGPGVAAFDIQAAPDKDAAAAAEAAEQKKAAMKGMMLAFIAGFFIGTVLVPMRMAPPGANGPKGVRTLGSFGCGAMFISFSSVCVIMQGKFMKVVGDANEFMAQNPDFQRNLLVQPKTLVCGLCGGLFFTLGNTAQIAAQHEPYVLPYGIAYTTQRCGLFFGGLVGIFLFKDVMGKAIGVFWVGALPLFLGVFLIGRCGPGAKPAAAHVPAAGPEGMSDEGNVTQLLLHTFANFLT